MITLHKLNGKKVIINAEHIKSIESIPDTRITLMNDQYYLFQESPEEILDKIITYKKNIFFHQIK